MAKTISFPEFCKTRFVPELAVRTFHSPSSRYDISVSRDILRFGFILDHASKTMSWDGLSIPMVPPVPSVPKTLITHYICANSTNCYHSYVNSTAQIKEAKYEQVTPQQVTDNSTHLQSDQKDSLIKLLRNFPHLFSGKLGQYNQAKFTLELQEPMTSPIFCKPYPVAQVHTAAFKKELQHLISEQVLE